MYSERRSLDKSRVQISPCPPSFRSSFQNQIVSTATIDTFEFADN